MSNILKTELTGNEDFTNETKVSLNNLSTKVFKKDLSGITSQQVRDLISIEMGIVPEKLNIHAGETRKIEHQFCTNNYSASMDFSLNSATSYILDEINKMTKDSVEDIIQRYLDLKNLLYKMVSVKYEGNEQFLRDLLRASQDKDSIIRAGRYNK